METGGGGGVSAYGKALRPGYSICKREVGGGEGVGRRGEVKGKGRRRRWGRGRRRRWGRGKRKGERKRKRIKEHREESTVSVTSLYAGLQVNC